LGPSPTPFDGNAKFTAWLVEVPLINHSTIMALLSLVTGKWWGMPRGAADERNLNKPDYTLPFAHLGGDNEDGASGLHIVGLSMPI